MLAPSRAAEAEPQVDFSAEIRPILSAKCFSCHGADEGSREAKLRLDVRDEAVRERKGGRHPIVAGDLARSEVITRITTKDADEVMPPVETKNPLEPREIELLRRWVQQGAVYSAHWAFTKPERSPLPRVSQPSWPRNGIDHFVFDKLAAAGLTPSREADKYTLLRRASLDVTGLPPTPADVVSFAKDTRPGAYERAVDRLLASSAYGERFARVWLDLARYADSAGYGSDPLRPNLWPYRDWVIDALNRNVSYDRFTVDQVAGDLVPNPTRDQIVATAFHRNTMTNSEGGTDDEEWRVAAVKDRANVTAQVWMGLTMGCAQCHTHKFDPITHREYYQFYAFFDQTEDSDKADERPTLPLWTPEQEAKRASVTAEIARLGNAFRERTPAFDAELAAWEVKANQPLPWVPLEVVSSLPAVATDGGEIQTIQVRAPLGRITAFRLEATGKFVLSDVQVHVLASKPKPVAARFVRIEALGQGKLRKDPRILSLAEVQVLSAGENVARKGKATQSSEENEGAAGRAVDGDTDGHFSSGSTTLTRGEPSPWWEVDLGQTRLLDEVVIWGRTYDDGEKKEKPSTMRVVALDDQRNPVWQTELDRAPTPTARLPLNGTVPAKLRDASADVEQKEKPARAILDEDGRKSGWAVDATPGHPRTLAFEVATPIGTGPDGAPLLTFFLRSFSAEEAGRFKLFATAQPTPVRLVPVEVGQVLARPAADRSAADGERVADFFRPLARTLAPITKEIASRKAELDAIKAIAVPVMRDLTPANQRVSHLFNKGNFLDPGEKVTPGVPAAFNPWPAGAPLNRLGLARWLTSQDNPLIARVAVNRLWAQLFGAGIVETEEDFGTQGTLPTHRELLDWLAVSFATPKKEARPNQPALGWDVKALVKLMVTSATYRQASAVTPQLLEKDPRNELYSRSSRRRLDAEAIRDQALALAGLLSRKVGGASVFPEQPEGLWRAAFNGERTWTTSPGEDRYRRGLYTFLRRTAPYPSMATFDAPSRESCSMRRIHTNTPLQAFVTLNDPVFFEAAQALGRRLVREGGKTPVDRVRYGLRLVLARPPTAAQIAPLVRLFQDELGHYRQKPEEALKLATRPLGALPAGLSPAEAAAWSVVGNVLLNLDSVLTKG